MICCDCLVLSEEGVCSSLPYGERRPHTMPFTLSWLPPPTSLPPPICTHCCHYLDALWSFLSWQTPTGISRRPPGGALPDCRSSLRPPGSHSTLHMAPTTLRALGVPHCPVSSSKGEGAESTWLLSHTQKVSGTRQLHGCLKRT